MGFQQGFRINTNTASLDTYRAYSKSQAGLEQNIERLSSGLRINSAKDDAAGLAISERMNNQVRGMQQANRNVQQANNMLQTAEGAISEIGNILGRMRELAVQSASPTLIWQSCPECIGISQNTVMFAELWVFPTELRLLDSPLFSLKTIHIC